MNVDFTTLLNFLSNLKSTNLEQTKLTIKKSLKHTLNKIHYEYFPAKRKNTIEKNLLNGRAITKEKEIPRHKKNLIMNKHIVLNCYNPQNILINASYYCCSNYY